MVTETPINKPKSGAVRQEATGLAPRGRPARGDLPTKMTQDILWESAQGEVPPGMTKDRYLSGFAQFLKSGPNKLIQIGNTVFMLEGKGPGVAELSVFSIEPPNVLPQRIKAGANTARQMGYRRIVAFIDSPALLNMLPQLQMKMQVSQGAKQIGGEMVPMTRVDVDL